MGMIERINSLINEYYKRTKNYADINEDDVNYLLNEFKNEMKADACYIVMTSIDKKSFKFIHYVSDDKKSYLNQEYDLTLENYLSQYMLYDKNHISTTPGVDIGINAKSNLYHGLVRGIDTDGTIGVLDFNNNRTWTEEEKESLVLIARCLHLYVYEKRVKLLKEQDLKINKELIDTKRDISIIKNEIFEILNLIISSSNDIVARVLKYNIDTNEGKYYKIIDKKVLEIKDDRCLDELVEFYNSKLDDIDIDMSYEINNMPYNVIKSYQFRSYECLGKIEPDNHIHSTAIRIIKTRIFDNNYILALLLDLTSYNKKNHQAKCEIEKFKNLLVSTFTKDFNDLTRLDLNTNEILKYYLCDGKVISKISNLSWKSLVEELLKNAISDNKEEIKEFLDYNNIKKLDYKFKKQYIVKYLINEEIKYISMTFKYLENNEDKSFLIYSNDVTKEVNLEKEIEELTELVNKDGLTNIYNRNGLYNSIDKINSCIKASKDSYLLFIDADRFKIINDNFGHLEGDKALINIASALNKIAKANDGYAFRNGGDEFILVLSTNDNIDNIISNIEKSLEIYSNDNYSLELTVGVAKLKANQVIDKEDLEKYIEIADMDLISKKRKKNLDR